MKRIIHEVAEIVLTIIVAIFATVGVFSLVNAIVSGNNHQKTVQAIIKLPNGEIIEGTAGEWSGDSSGSCKIQIDGKKYRTGFENVVIIEEEGKK